MERLTNQPRPNWEATIESQGLTYHRTDFPDGSVRPYWNETAHYRFTMEEVLELERVTGELTDMCLAAAEEIIERDRFSEVGIPRAWVNAIRESWEAEPPSIYGRFDLCYRNGEPVKLLEFNADTPTALVESSVIQWMWLQDQFPDLDQWNSIHERIIETWIDVKPHLNSSTVYFARTAGETSGEDLMDTAYMRDCAQQAGLNTVGINVEDIGWDTFNIRFTGLNRHPIHAIFKLYPWEWMLNESFAEHILSTWDQTGWIEPMWKVVCSGKGILPILWELFPDHPNLLPTYFGHPHDLESFVRKPLFGREGANTAIITPEKTIETGGQYGEEGYVFQQFHPLPSFDGSYPVPGSWVIGLEPAGCGIRESDGLITDNLSRFVPHVIEG